MLLLVSKIKYLTLVISRKKNRLLCKNIRNEKKYFTTFDYNKFTNNILDANIKEKMLINESNIAYFVKKAVIDDKTKKY